MPAGYSERTEPSTGMHDPLKTSVLVLDDGPSRAKEEDYVPIVCAGHGGVD